MSIIQADDLGDLIKVTQKELGRLKLTDLSYSLQEHIALSQLLKRSRVSFTSGTAIQWNVMTETSGGAGDSAMFSVDNINIGDVMRLAEIPWRHWKVGYAIERREIAMNREPARIYELVKIRRADAMIDMAKHAERRVWGGPSISSNETHIYGIPWWIQYNATEGFTGGNPSGFSDTAGIDCNTYSQWKNYSGQYSSIDDNNTATDLITMWRKAATFTGFMAPYEQPSYDTGLGYGYYTNYTVLGTLEYLLTQQNDNLGNDVASKDGKTVFRGVPVTWVPYLENTSSNPVYGIHWGTFQSVFLSGEYMREFGPTIAPSQHTVYQTFIDTTLNIRCTDRRRQFVLAVSDPATHLVG